MSDRDSGRPPSLGEGGVGAVDQPRRRSWEKLSQWVCCVCVVTFDLELGQAIEVSFVFCSDNLEVEVAWQYNM